MRISLYALVVAALALLPVAELFAQPVDADHVEPGPTHVPRDLDKPHHHAHPEVDLAHPIVGESPLPETHLKLRYSFADPGGGGREHTISAELEYALAREFSIEAVLPYTFLDGDEQSGDHFNDSEIAFKLAPYWWVDHNVLPAIGVGIVLPTGDEEQGIGSDHVIEVEPFARIGIWHEPFEFIAGITLGVPLHRKGEEKREEDLAVGYHVSILYHVAPSVQALIEVHGESVFSDLDDEHSLYISPGLMIQPFHDKSISFGAGVSLPLTDDRDFDYAINLLALIHF